MAVPVTDSVTLSFGRPVELFPIARVSGLRTAYAVHPDGKRFIVAELRDSDKQRPPHIHIVQNWPALLRQATATPGREP